MGCVLSEIYEYVMYSHLPTRRVEVVFKNEARDTNNARDEMLQALNSFAVANGFTVALRATTQDGSRVIVQMIRSDCNIIADNPANRGEFKVDLYPSLLTKADSPGINYIVRDLIDNLGRIPGVVVLEK